MSLNGLLLVHKDSGMTSHDVVAKTRRMLGTKEVGHCGTLDPMASGLLVLLVGQATKLSQYILEADKSYRVGFKLGFETDTLDTTGKITKTAEINVSVEGVIEKALNLAGEFSWPVPHFSAVKIDGEKLYEKARRGDVFETPKKVMSFWGIQIVSSVAEGTADLRDLEFVFDLSCSKGSFVRTWVQELGLLLGCGATMSSLVRTSSNPYELKSAQTLQQTESEINQGSKLKNFVPIAFALPQAKRIRVQGQTFQLLKNGQISYDLKSQLIQLFQPGVDQIVQILDPAQNLLALVGHEREKGFQIRRVFHSESH